MNTKIVYVLVSSENDIYLEQAYISMYSLKYYMPKSTITLITDRQTAETLHGNREKETKYVDEWVIVDLDGNRLNAQQRSRQLKTSTRNRIDGDFLFIDCDTIVVRPLDAIDNTKIEIAACKDTHCKLVNNPYRGMHLRDGHKLNWPIDNEEDYFNTGVIFVKDTCQTRDFYKRWNENLNLGYPKNVYMDQPSFAKTNFEMGHIVQQLPDIWNCELKHGIRYLKDAKIVHYLCTNPSVHQNQQLFLLNEKDSLLEIKRSGIINDTIKSIVEDPFCGLAEVTHCFSGEDLFFFQTPAYNYLRQHYKKGEFSTFDKVVIYKDWATSKINHLISKLRH